MNDILEPEQWVEWAAEEIDSLRAKLQAAEELNQQLINDVRETCLVGLAQSAVLKRLESRAEAADAEVARLKEQWERRGEHMRDWELHCAEKNTRIAELEAHIDRLRQERMDYSSVTTTDGLNASEWIWRTGAAEREAKAATEAALRFAYLHPVDSANNDIDTFVRMGLKALLGEGEK